MKFQGYLWILMIGLLQLSVSSTEVQANPHWGPTRCGHFSSQGFVERGGKYCVFTTGGSRNQDVVYYFHGAMGSERDWELNPQMLKLRAYWSEQGHEPPIVVGISFGPGWMVAPKAAGKRGGLLELIMDHYIPFIEKEVVYGFKGRRILLGASMGSFNALQLFSRRPQFFNKVMLMCPAISAHSPWDDEAVLRFARSGRMHPRLAKKALQIMRETFDSNESWFEHGPIGYLERSINDVHLNTPVYVQINEADEMGFNVANIMPLENLIAQQSGQWEFDHVPGRHCQIDQAAAFHFFQR